MPYQIKDATTTKSAALPNGAATTATAAVQVQGSSSLRDFVASVELKLTIPALTTTELGDTQTITYTIETSDDSAFGSGNVTISLSTVQTGAGGAGATGTTVLVKPNSALKSYVRAKAVKTGASNASTSSMTLDILS